MNKSNLVEEILKNGVLQPKDVAEVLSKKGLIVSPHYISRIKFRLIKKNKLKAKKKKTKIDLVLEMIKEGFDNQDIFEILRKKRIYINKPYISFIRKNFNTFINRTKTAERRSTIYFRGKKLSFWAEELNLSKCRIHQMYNKEKLGDRIDGKLQAKASKEIVFKGKTFKEWADKLGYSYKYVYNLYRNKKLESKIDGTWEAKNGRIIQGKNMTQWAKLLGITKERVRQLANVGKLEDRIKKINTSLEI